MSFVFTFLGPAASLWVATWLIDGFEFDGTWWQFLIVAVLVGLANVIVKPLAKLISLPLMILTLGLFTIVVNALVLQLVVWLSGPDVLDLGLASDGFFWSTFLASIVISLVGWLLSLVLPNDGRLTAWT